MTGKNVKILECTLRDGLRIVNCKFEDSKIKNIADGLAEAGVDIIEMGFLRDKRIVNYKGASTFFTDMRQITPFICNKFNSTSYAVFIDYGMFDFSTLCDRAETAVDSIRLGFTKKDYINNKTEIVKAMLSVKEKGYRLFMQGVNSLGYTDSEFIELINLANRVRPYSFAIVDTYGAMYSQDLQHYYDLIDFNLSPEIAVDFHSHNNYQLSFSLAQEILKRCFKRTLIIDCTLNGIGKVAGNLNTELIINFMNRKYGYDFDEDKILDLIDEHLYDIRTQQSWGYSIPAFLAGEMQSHPNNILYLTQKLRLDTKDIKYILKMIEPQLRQRYDYDNIERLYIEYNSRKKDDIEEISKLSDIFSKKKRTLIIGPGSSILKHRKNIIRFINENRPIVVCVNFVPNFIKVDYVFFGSTKRYNEYKGERSNIPVIVTSNVKSEDEKDIIVNYSKVIDDSGKNFDSSIIMLLNLMKRIGVKNIFMAGIDGFFENKQNYFDAKMEYGRNSDQYEEQSVDMEKMMRTYKERNEGTIKVRFITPSRYDTIFDMDVNNKNTSKEHL